MMTSSIAVQVSVFLVMASLRPRSTFSTPHGSLLPYDYYTADDAVYNATAVDHDDRTEHARHNYVTYNTMILDSIDNLMNRRRQFIKITGPYYINIILLHGHKCKR
ncbi:uncharacterized protein LOC112597804 isoform X1 [Melanaphis sacchari]|uniref:uncharacterized protein LOC112597804 isoform X1 n=1 Tax=Melanaphis sacchari TaxID=742174 RepID=UPI000DC136B4|nr:uncharacterized protein LOC112597804 isoform X1 [Melanaphis sacchari]